MKHVNALSEKEKLKVQDLYSYSKSRRVRLRAHCVLLCNDNYSIEKISKILGHNRITISLWIDKYNKNGIDKLADSVRSGRPPILTESDENKVLKEVAKNSRSLNKVIIWIKENLNKTISKDTLIRILKKRNMYGSGCEDPCERKGMSLNLKYYMNF